MDRWEAEEVIKGCMDEWSVGRQMNGWMQDGWVGKRGNDSFYVLRSRDDK